MVGLLRQLLLGLSLLPQTFAEADHNSDHIGESPYEHHDDTNHFVPHQDHQDHGHDRAHGAHGHKHQEPMLQASYVGGPWAALHMSSEHHVGGFDAVSFFQLHDFDESGAWDYDEIHRFLGFDDPTTDAVGDQAKHEAVEKVLKIFDDDKDDYISKEEWLRATRSGRQIPDFGYGPGHHGDDELEYELHHFEEFHNEDDTVDDLIHPEDIAHFKKHEREDQEAELMERFDRQTIVEANIPAKFKNKP